MQPRVLPALAVMAFASLHALDSVEAQAQTFTCPPGSPVCAALSASDNTIEPGDIVQLEVAYALIGQPTGPFTNFTLELEGPDWFHGSAYVPNAEWDENCILDNTPTYRVTCNWTYNTETIEIENGVVRPGVFPISFMVPAYSLVPDDYDGLFTLTVRATQNGTDHAAVATTSINVVGWADVTLNRLVSPGSGLGTSTVQTVDFDGAGGNPPVQGRVITMFVRIDNRTAGQTDFGSNALQDAVSTIVFPSWMQWLGFGSQTNDFGTPAAPVVEVLNEPTAGAFGGTAGNHIQIRPTANTPLGTAGTATDWRTRSGGSAPGTRRIQLRFFVACSTLDAGQSPGLDATELAALDDGSSVTSGNEAIVDPVNGTVLEARSETLDNTFRTLLDQGSLFGSCIPVAGTRSKGSNYGNSWATLAAGPERGLNWTLTFTAPQALSHPFQNIRIIDPIPPYTSFRSFSPSAALTRHWACVLPDAPYRTLELPGAGNTIPGLGVASTPDADGVPRFYQYNHSEFDPATLPWDTNTSTGCVDLAVTPSAMEQPTLQSATNTYVYATPTASSPALFQARQVTHVVFETPTWSRPTVLDPYPTLSATINTIVNDDNVPTPEGPIPTRAYTRNVARFYGGTFDSNNDGTNDGSLATTYDYSWVSWQQLIDWEARLTPIHHAYGDTTMTNGAGGSLYARDISGAVTAGFIGYGAGALDPRLTIDLPPGFDLAYNSDRITKASTNYVWDVDLTTGVVTPVDTIGAVGKIGINRIANDIYPGLIAAGVAQSQIVVTATNLGTPGAADWTVAFQFPSAPRIFHGYYNTTGDTRQPFTVGVVAPSTYPFTYLAQPSVLTVSASNAPVAATQTRNLFVTVQEEAQAEIFADCDPGDPRPMLRLVVSNTGGALVTGLRGMAILPTTSSGGTPIVFRGAEIIPNSWLPNAQPQFLEATTSVTPTDPATVWVPLSGPGAMDPADYPTVRAIRAGYGTDEGNANHGTAPYTGFEVAIRLDHPTATVSDIGETFTGTALVTTTRIPWAQSEPSPPYTIGQCPAHLVVRKYFDRNGDGVEDGNEEDLANWNMTATIGNQSPLDAIVFDIDTNDRVGTTGDDGTVTFDVWPGQSFVVSEAIPAPVPVPTGRPAPWDSGTLSWSNTSSSNINVTVELVQLDETVFGNACACGADSQCVTGVCDTPTTCVFTEVVLDCAAPTDLCLTPGVCDDATGGCFYPEKDCDPTTVYIEMTDGEGAIRWVSCDVTPDADGNPTLDCDRDDDGIVDVLPTNAAYCGP